MANMVNYHTFKYGACTVFWRIYKFCINVNNWSYIYCFDNKTLGKSGWWINYVTQTGNWYKTFSIKPTCFLFPFVVRKATVHVDTKALNIRHQSQKGFCAIFVGIPQHHKGYLVYVPSASKIFSSHDVVLDKTFSSALA